MQHHAINYVEFGATNLAATKKFYADAFGWTFTDYGPSYVAFSGAGLDGGFTTEAQPGINPLVILYSERLDDTKAGVVAAGGTIVKDTYEFPGGKRFHFADPSGNELAVWSDK